MMLKCRNCKYEQGGKSYKTKENEHYEQGESTRLELTMLMHIHQVTFKHTVDLIE